MRKLSHEQGIYFENRRRKLLKRDAVSKRKQKNKQRCLSFKVTKNIKHYGTSEITITLPRIFSLEDNYEEVVEFINIFREETTKKDQSVYVDFTTLQKIHADAALLLGAEFDRWRRLRGIKLRVKKLSKWNPEIRRLMSEMGLFDLLDVHQPKNDTNNADFDNVYIKFSTHNAAEGEYARKFRESLEEKLEATLPGKKYLFNGITEAMTNVMHHAYPDDATYFFEPIKHQWWMAGSFNKEVNCATIVFIDQGIGIPQALPSRYPTERIKDFIAKIGLSDTDASRIKAAMNLGRTSTELQNRGRGLVNIRSFVANSKTKARLRIVSGRGEYVFYSDGTDELITHKQSIGGTLIQWLIYFEE